MITRKDIQNIIKKNKPLLKKEYKVDTIGIFGSFARGDFSEKSDIDIIVEFVEPVGFEFLDLKYFLEKLFGRKVDLVTKPGLKPQMKEAILKEVQYS